MQIADNSVVLFHYSLVNEQGEVIEGSRGGDPLPYLHGHRNIVPGLEKALTGRSVGDKFTIQLQPEEGYGLRDEDKVYVVDRASFAGFDTLETGMLCQMEDPEGQPEYVTVVDINDEEVTVDGNHPYAGQVLNFDVEVVAVREATESELAAGRIEPA
ncbi:peptidylprolyl isomerase [Neptuniibacter sp. CAU 1671]|uniref:FKBP-type peptidyl-prolyl cis-trans isomerase n=1 Tax=Neptuniibacter sp. CAU 1671 TaxID=3032593 RepID=UPI0023DCEAF5|nr:peptidylprolyl isomerase [Neptuniibacter sp. CAU 1671]MDF2181860.1 peptidylprolyl isomerase [Neptuniibacter sp. CAU 1671]